MSEFAIQARGLSKAYRIGSARERHDTLRDLVGSAVRAPLRNFRKLKEGGGDEVFWALRDVSFDVKHGEVLGVIGRNGAGKSTLLKVLSRITEPSAGRAVVHGRVGSLLEVGTGFHPELTGRENIFLNGSILGMDRAYIERRFDEIVSFAGVERFIDTPVKRYSSGMYLRLAFAVAAHLEPEILIVDEVLAVGDQEFQRKCVGKMSEVAGEGRTVLFVSHNMGAVTKLCQRAIVMGGGQKIFEGTAREALDVYLSAGMSDAAEREWPGDDAPGDASGRLRAVRITQPAGVAVSRVHMEEPFAVEIEHETLQSFPDMNVQLIIHDDSGETILHSSLEFTPGSVTKIGPGRHLVTCRFPAALLNTGHYWLTVKADEPFIRWVWSADRILRFEVDNTAPALSRYPVGWIGGPMGPLLPRWTQEALDDAPAAR